MDLLKKLKEYGPSCIFLTCGLESVTDTFEYKIIAVIEGKQYELYKTRNPITAIKEIEACCLKYSIRNVESSSIKNIEKNIKTLEEHVAKLVEDKKEKISELQSLTKKDIIQKAREIGVDFKTAMSKDEIINIIIEN